MEMIAQTMANIVHVFVTLAPNLLHHNNVGVTYVGTSNFIMELVRSIPLHYVVMLEFMIIVIEVPFVSTPVHTVVGMRFKPQTLKGTKLVSVHAKMPREVNNIFTNQSS